MNKALCFLVLACCAQAQASSLLYDEALNREIEANTRAAERFEASTKAAEKTLPAARPADLAAIASYSRIYPTNAVAFEDSPMYKRPDGDKPGARPWIEPERGGRITWGKLTTEYKESSYSSGLNGQDETCTYPEGGLYVQVEEYNPRNFIAYMVDPSAPVTCESFAWRSVNNERYSMRLDSWRAVTFHWKRLNRAFITGAHDFARGGWSLATDYPLLSVPLLAACAWLARRLYRRRRAANQ